MHFSIPIFLALMIVLAAPVLRADKPAPAANRPPATAVDPFQVGQRAFNAKQYDRARELWLPLAERGDARSQYAIGRMYEKGHGVSRNLETAAAWYHQAAEQGHADSQYRLSVGYAYGLGVKKNDATALSWLRKAAELGQNKAQKALARAYRDGLLGLTPDPKQAKYWYDKAETNP